MRWNKVSAVIKREYMTRVRNKGFILSLVLMPLFMAILTVLPSLMMQVRQKTGDIKTVVVIDETGELLPQMRDAIAHHPFFVHKDKLVYELIEEPSDFKGNPALKKQLNQKLESKAIHGYMEIPKDVFERLRVNYYGKRSTEFELYGAFKDILSRLVTNKRLIERGYPAEEVRALMRNVDFDTFAVSLKDKGDAGTEERLEGAQATGIKLGFGYLLIFLLYLFIFMYASSVMASVLEEKTTRIVEVIISSIRPYQLLLGKIVGVCAVCLTMFIIWALCSVLLISNVHPLLARFGVEEPPNIINDAIKILTSVGPTMLLYFAIYFVSGFVLFSTLYATIGAVCNNNEEAQSLTFPVALLLIVPFMMMFGLFRNPDSPLTVALSHFPFFSPILMFMRICVLMPPWWEIALNIIAMLTAIFLVVLITGKIYKVGILMYGKRPSMGELWRWLRY